ncbi:MAG: hypothetical protein IJF59_02905, partial [Clostridia bacterium]|nr:hypothetical protein [Clostridia bacterium]
MARNRYSRPYTGRRHWGRFALILAVILLLIFAFLSYTYRTSADFRNAVASLTAVLHGETPPERPEPEPEEPAEEDAQQPV